MARAPVQHVVRYGPETVILSRQPQQQWLSFKVTYQSNACPDVHRITRQCRIIPMHETSRKLPAMNIPVPQKFIVDRGPPDNINSPPHTSPGSNIAVWIV